MELTQKQLLKLQQALKVGKCPHCGSIEPKHRSPHIFHLVSYEVKDSMPVMGENNIPNIPLAALHCPNCGYEMLFNLSVLGVIE